jgi:hypothetical protein
MMGGITLGRMCATGCARRRADALRGVHVHVLAHADDGAAHDARAADAQQQPQRDDDLRHARAHHRHHHDQDDEVGKAHPRVDEALHQQVETCRRSSR